jgi:hypothetical protein
MVSYMNVARKEKKTETLTFLSVNKTCYFSSLSYFETERDVKTRHDVFWFGHNVSLPGWKCDQQQAKAACLILERSTVVIIRTSSLNIKNPAFLPHTHTHTLYPGPPSYPEQTPTSTTLQIRHKIK